MRDAVSVTNWTLLRPADAEEAFQRAMAGQRPLPSMMMATCSGRLSGLSVA